MKKISKYLFLLCTGISILLSCKKEPVYVFAENGPQMTLVACDETAWMGGRITFSVDLADPDFALSTLKGTLYFDRDPVADVTVRTKTEGRYEASVEVPYLSYIPDGAATLEIVAQNVGQACTFQSVKVAVSRPVFQTIDIVAGTQKYSMAPPASAGSYLYSAAGPFPASRFSGYIEAVIPGTEDVISFGLDEDDKIVAGGEDEIVFGGVNSISSIVFDGFSLTSASVNDPDAGNVLNMTATGYGYACTTTLEQDETVVINGVEDITAYYFDPDYVAAEGGQPVFKAVSGTYKVEFYTEGSFVRFTRVRADGSDAGFADGALWLRGWGIAQQYMGGGQLFGWDGDGMGFYCMAEIRENVFQFTGTAVAEQDKTPGGRFRYDYIDIKYFFKSGYGSGEAVKSQISTDGNAASLLKITDQSNINLASDLEQGSTYRLTIDLSNGNYNGSSYTGTEKITFEKLQ